MQLIQYIYMHTYTVHLSPLYSTQWHKRPSLTQEYLVALRREITVVSLLWEFNTQFLKPGVLYK